MEIYIMEVL